MGPELLREHAFRTAQSTAVLTSKINEGKSLDVAKAETDDLIKESQRSSQNYLLPGEGLKRYLLGSDQGHSIGIN